MFKIAKLSAVVAAVAALSVPAFAQMTEQAQPAQSNPGMGQVQTQPGQMNPAAQPGMAAPAATTGAMATGSANIVETAAQAGQFNTFAKVCEAAGLTETLRGPGPFTVFAPTDAAFAKVPADKLAEWMKPENKMKLADLLKAHVVSGKVTAAEVSKMDSAKSLAGADLTVKAEGADVMVENAKVTKADIMASNGVIHVIDAVIMPTE